MLTMLSEAGAGSEDGASDDSLSEFFFILLLSHSPFYCLFPHILAAPFHFLFSLSVSALADKGM